MARAKHGPEGILERETDEQSGKEREPVHFSVTPLYGSAAERLLNGRAKAINFHSLYLRLNNGRIIRYRSPYGRI